MTVLLIAALAVWLWWCLVFAERKHFIFALTAPFFYVLCFFLLPFSHISEWLERTANWVFDHPADW